MNYFAGLDVSLDTVNVCIVNDAGDVLLERKIEAEPAVIADLLARFGHVIEEGNRRHFADQLDQQHCLRHDIYIGERNWRALRVIDGREYDQFDQPSAIYLLTVTEDGEVAGGTRLLQSTEPTLLSEVFPHLADMKLYERAPDVLEWTRSSSLRASVKRAACAELAASSAQPSSINACKAVSASSTP